MQEEEEESYETLIDSWNTGEKCEVRFRCWFCGAESPQNKSLKQAGWRFHNEVLDDGTISSKVMCDLCKGQRDGS